MNHRESYGQLHETESRFGKEGSNTVKKPKRPTAMNFLEESKEDFEESDE